MPRKVKRKLKKKYKIFLFVLLIVISIFSVKKILNNNIKTEEIKKEEEIKTEEYKVDMVMVGDAIMHTSVYNDAARLANNNGYNFKPQIELIKEKVKNYDILYYNQETVLGGSSLGVSGYPAFNSPQEFGDAMVDAGFNLVSLATNHTYDVGEKAILSQREYWNNKKNVQAVGSYSSQEEKTNIETTILEKNNITYALLNYTYGTNGNQIPSNKSYLVNVWDTTNNYEAYKETVKKDIANIRDKVDVLIVAMHWGVEYTHTPTSLQKDAANFLASLDVDIVIGTHPHVVQPIEWIDDTLVFYSLGNFISSQYQNDAGCYNYMCLVGLMPSLTITKTIDNGQTNITIDNIKTELIYTYYSENRDNIKVIPFSDEEIKDHLTNYEEIYKTYATIVESDDERINTIPVSS